MQKNKLLISFSTLMLTALPMTAMAQGSIDMYKQAHNEAAELRQLYKNQQEKRQNKKDLVQTELGLKNNEANTKKALKEKQDYEKQSEANSKELFKAENEVVAIKLPSNLTGKTHGERIDILKEEAKSLTDKLVALRKHYDAKVKEAQTADNNGEYWEHRADVVSGNDNVGGGKVQVVNKDGITNEQAVRMALEKIGHDENRLEEAEKIRAQIMNGSEVDDSKAEAEAEKRQAAVEAEYNAYSLKAQYYRGQAVALYAEAEALESEIARYEEALDKTFTYLEAEENYENYVSEAKELQGLKAENKTYLEDLVKEKEELYKEKSRLTKALAGEATGKYDSMSMEYYSWRNNNGSKGRQLYIPMELYIEDKYSEYGLSTAVVKTSNKSLTGMRDVNLHYGYRNVHNRFEVKYTIDASLPTGKNRTRNVNVDDDRVPVTRLGEGLIVKPGIEIKRFDGEENIWRLRTGYQFRDGYDSGYDEANATKRISPGNVIDYDLDWTRITEKYQMRLGVTNSSYGTGMNYGLDNSGNPVEANTRDGDSRLYKAMYNRHLSKASDLMGYFWFRHYGANKYGGTNSSVRYYGIEYKYNVDKNSAWYAYCDNMLSTGLYTPSDGGVPVNGREKHNLGLAYEQKVNEKWSFRFGFDYYWMWDNDGTRYHGLEYKVNVQGSI